MSKRIQIVHQPYYRQHNIPARYNTRTVPYPTNFNPNHVRLTDITKRERASAKKERILKNLLEQMNLRRNQRSKLGRVRIATGKALRVTKNAASSVGPFLWNAAKGLWKAKSEVLDQIPVVRYVDKGVDTILQSPADLLEHLSKKAYDDYFTRKDTVTKEGLSNVIEAGEFMLNSYNETEEISGFKYIWLHLNNEDKSFLAYGINPNTGKANLVFGFRGTVPTSPRDLWTDVNSSHASTITEWCGYELPVKITAATGFLNRILSLSKVGLEELVDCIIKAYEEKIDDDEYMTLDDDDEAVDEAIEYDDAMDDDDDDGGFYNGEKIPGPAFEALWEQHEADLEKARETHHSERVEARKHRLRPQPYQPVAAVTMGEYEDLSNFIRTHEIDDILVTGHSLGGAASTVFGVILGEVLPPELAVKIRIITFEPARALRISTRDELLKHPLFQTIYNNSIFVTNGNDPVPQMPMNSKLEGLFLGFTHWGISYFIPREAIGKEWLAAHSSDNVMEVLQKLVKLDDAEKDKQIFISNGSGVIKGRRRRTTTTTTTTTTTKSKKKKTSSAEMKAKMAYVRSFRRK